MGGDGLTHSFHLLSASRMTVQPDIAWDVGDLAVSDMRLRRRPVQGRATGRAP